jgi:DNA-binding FadR family transcriptional regulator
MFHSHSLSRSGNETLCGIYDGLKSRIYAYRRIVTGMPRHFLKHAKYHRKIMEAYEAVDGKKADRHFGPIY